MKDFIEAMNIFLKYGNVNFPFLCEDGLLHVCGYKLKDISDEDYERLQELNFEWDEDLENFISFTYGSC